MTSTRSAAAALAAPLAVGTATVAAALTLYVRDPRTSTYLACPFHALTGLWCPGCGATRALGALVHGDVASALSDNMVVVAALVMGVAVWAGWFAARVRGRDFRLRRPNRATVVVSVAAVVAFTVLRNTPWGLWLAPS